MADNFNQNGDMTQAVAEAMKQEKKKKKKKRLIIFAVIAVVVIVVIALASGSSDSDSSSTVKNGTTASQKAEEKKDEKVKPGGSVTIEDELEISYTDCNTDFKKYSYIKPADGNKVISATFTIKNISDSDQYIDTITCYADDQKCEWFYGADDAEEDPFVNSISSGRSVSGTVYFEVAKDAKDIELEFENNIWTEEKVVFVVE